MKKYYESPVMIVVALEKQDIITISNGGTGTGGSTDWGSN